MDTSRVVVHIDIDAFYAQCEELRDPSLRLKPLGVTQKYLIVTANYPARSFGVSKLMGIKDAQQRCPELVLISGEDLTPYRQASKQVLAVLRRFGEAEKLGMDEVIVDVTEEVNSRIARGSAPPSWNGHVHRSELGVVQENRHRIMDLRAGACSAALVPLAPLDAVSAEWHLKLMVGSQIAAEARAALKAEAGFRSSAGIACNRMLAKLSSGLHKPDDQTVLPPTEAAAFVAPLPLRAIPGVGSKLGAELKELGLDFVGDLRPWSKASLVQKFGERVGSFLHLACRGLDPTPVKAKQPPKAVTVEDSFKSCTSLDATRHILQILAPDLLARLHEEFQDEGRRPRTLTLKWRHRSNGFLRNSASCLMPSAVQVHMPPDGPQAAGVVQAALSLFTRNVSGPFVLTLLNLGATNFTQDGSSSDGRIPAAFSRFLSAPATQAAGSETGKGIPIQNGGRRMADALTQSRRDYGAAPAGAPVTKTQERRLREQQASAGLQPEHAVTDTLNPNHQTLRTGLESRERQREEACWSADDFDDSQESLIEARAAINPRKASSNAVQVVHQGAGPGKQPAESGIRGAQAHRQSGGLAIQPGQDLYLGLYGSNSQLGTSGRTSSGGQGQRNIPKAAQLPRTLQSFFRDVPSKLPESSSGGAHQRAFAGTCAELCPDFVGVVTPPAASSDERVLDGAVQRQSSSVSMPARGAATNVLGSEQRATAANAANEELAKLKALLSRKSSAVNLDEDALLARRLQENELGMGRTASGGLKRARTGPLDTFFTRTKRPN